MAFEGGDLSRLRGRTTLRRSLLGRGSRLLGRTLLLRRGTSLLRGLFVLLSDDGDDLGVGQLRGVSFLLLGELVVLLARLDVSAPSSVTNRNVGVLGEALKQTGSVLATLLLDQLDRLLERYLLGRQATALGDGGEGALVP